MQRLRAGYGDESKNVGNCWYFKRQGTMRIILETSNKKEFIEYTGAAITALLAQTEYNTLPFESDCDGLMIVSYIYNGRIYNLHMSNAFKYGAYEAENLSRALFYGEESEDTFQLQKITSHEIPEEESGLPEIVGQKVSY